MVKGVPPPAIKKEKQTLRQRIAARIQKFTTLGLFRMRQTEQPSEVIPILPPSSEDKTPSQTSSENQDSSTTSSNLPRYTLEVGVEANEDGMTCSLGLFTGTLYPSHKIRSQAFYRGFIGLVGPKPGDWVETVGTSTDDNDKTLSFGHQRNRSLDGIFVLREEKVEEPTQSTNPHDLNLLMDELNHIQQQLKRSEARRKELLDDLASTNVRNEEREVALRKQIESQESLNRKVRPKRATSSLRASLDP